MLRIGLLSDTHHFLDNAIFSHFESCDEIWHAGDFGTLELAHQLAGFRPLRGVYGNIDGQDIRSSYPEKLRWQSEGVRVQMTKGSPIEADLVLMATGRRPNLEGLGLSELGVDDSSFLKVDERMRLSRPGLYAIGDVNGLSLLDSTACSQASVAINSILGREGRFNPTWIPRCIHSEPSIAAVGFTEEEAKARAAEHQVISHNILLMSDLERSVVDPEPTFLKIIVETRSRHLLGCLAVGDHASVIVNIATIAMQSKLTVDQLLEMPLIQLSASEALMTILRKVG